MDLKEYQEEALKRFERWVAMLHEARDKSEMQVEKLREVGVDESTIKDAENYPKLAWKNVSEGEHISRFDRAGRPIPHVCLKVPTGGGKTLMAADVLRRLGLRNGLVLWVVPTTKIYEQTLSKLKNRESPIRQRLDMGCGGRLKVFEKDDAITKLDIDNCLCVMILILHSTNRNRNKYFLRINRDSGRYESFFPDEDDTVRNDSLKKDSGLEINEEGAVMRSLANVMRMMRPVVVLDEAHKAYGKTGKEYSESINSLNPSMVVEMSATPNHTISNLLVDVKGKDLWSEEMIKMPIDLNVQTDSDWKNMVHVVCSKLQSLEEDAKALYERYIRPIAVIRVERTGKDQRGGGFVHVDDVKEYLERTLGVPSGHIAIQSSDTKELKDIDLMSETSPIRYIITKSALQEGWDCPFAYILAILDNIKAGTAVTQLIGRVLRQPGANRTGIESLDRCYVYCHHEKTGKAAGYVRDALSGLGMGDVAHTVSYADPDKPPKKILKRSRVGGNVFLPVVLHKDKDTWKELDYNSHILPSVNFGSIHAPDPKQFDSKKQGWEKHVISLDQEANTKPEIHIHDSKSVGVIDVASRLYDIMPNMWQAARISQEFLTKLYDSGKTAQDVYNSLPYISNILYGYVADQINRQAERVFRDKLKRGIIRFDLEMNDRNYNIENYKVQKGRLLQRDDGTQVQHTLLEPVYEEEFDNNLERDFARYLDEKKAVSWWHRVAAQQRDGYHLAGWRKSRVYPDFIVMTNEAGDKARLGIYDTKGEQLEGNLDTKYKGSLLKTLQGAFDCGKVRVNGFNMRGEFRLVFDGQFDEVLV